MTCPQNSCSPATSVARLIDQRLSLRAITSAYRLSPPNSSPTRPPFPDLEECKTRNRRSKQIYRARERSVDNWTAPCGNPGNSSLDEIRQVQPPVNPALRRCKSGMIVEQKCPTICLYHGANHCHAFGCFVEERADYQNPWDNDDERYECRLSTADMVAERIDLRSLTSRGTKRTPKVTDQTIAGRNGIARK